jgi:hypothetical protein
MEAVHDMRALFTIVAAVAASCPTPASATSDTGTITVEIEVAEIIELTVDEPSLRTIVDSTTPTDLAGRNGSAYRAAFTVVSNSDYTLTASVPQTFVAPDVSPDYRQVKFSNDEGGFIGGTLFIDTNGVERQNSGNAGLERWDGDTGKITLERPAGTHAFGLGGAFDATIAGDEGGYQPDLIAPPGIYSTIVTLEAVIR